MKLTEIIKKALKGEELNALEKAELERFDPDALTQRAADAENQLKEAREKLDAAEQDKRSAAESSRAGGRTGSFCGTASRWRATAAGSASHGQRFGCGYCCGSEELRRSTITR